MIKQIDCILVFLGLSASSISAQSIRIGIIAALPQELNLITHSLKNKKVEVLYNRKIYTGEIGETKVVALLADVGKVNASISSQLVLSHYQCDALILTGLAGGLNAKYEIGDVIIAKEVFQHDYGFWGKEGFIVHKPGTVPEIGIGTGKEPIMQSISKWPKIKDPKAFFNMVASIKSMRPSFEEINVSQKSRKPNIYIGTVSTGDQFIANDSKRNELLQLGADVVEMEGAAIAKVASVFDVPLIIIRTISDKAGFRAEIDFPTFIETVSKNNAKIITQLLQSEEFIGHFI